MPIHVIEPGEDVGSVAVALGVPWRTIWEDVGNAELRARRDSPWVLAAGDVLVVPDAAGPMADPPTTKLCVRLLGEAGPRRDEPVRLVVDGSVIEATTSGEGWLDVVVPAGAEAARLELDAGREIIGLTLGALEPADTEAGARQRLRALGRWTGGATEDGDPAWPLALGAFQTEHRLECTGTLDTATAAHLREAYGC